MSSDFQVGDEIVCVDVAIPPDYSLAYQAILKTLVLNKVYTITELRLSQRGQQLVVCVDNIRWGTGKRFGFDPKRFRKVQKKFSGMETLQGLLKIKTKELIDG